MQRTGGHTGGCGFLYVAGEGIAAGSFGAMSPFDLIPTLLDLSGETKPSRMSGASRAARVGVAVPPSPRSDRPLREGEDLSVG